MNDQVKTADDPALAALRERAKDVALELDGLETTRLVLQARLAEINATIEIVQRNGRKKPGPKPGGKPATESGETAAAPPGDAA